MSNLKDFLGSVYDAFIPPVIDNAFRSAFPCSSLPPYCKPAQNQHIPGCRCNLQSQPQPMAYNPIWANPNPNMAYNSNPSEAYNLNPKPNRSNLQSQQRPNNQQRPYPFHGQTIYIVPMTSVPDHSFNPNVGYNPNISYNPTAANTMTYRGPNGGPMTNKPNQSFNPNMGYDPNKPNKPNKPNQSFNPNAANTMNNCD